MEFSSQPNQAIFRPDQTSTGPAKLAKLVWSAHQASLCPLFLHSVQTVLEPLSNKISKAKGGNWHIHILPSFYQEMLTVRWMEDCSKIVVLFQISCLLYHSISQEPGWGYPIIKAGETVNMHLLTVKIHQLCFPLHFAKTYKQAEKLVQVDALEILCNTL